MSHEMREHIEEAIRPKARESIHVVILDWLKRQKPGKVLDVPAGYGHLSLKMKQMHFEVSCGEIEPHIFKAPDLQCIQTDLNDRIDAPDGSFDYITCVDGLEHMTNPYRAVEELSRVLRSGGFGIFSIPNYANMEKRLKFLQFGHLTKPVSLEQYERSGKNLYNFHNSPLTITLLEFIFRINNLEIIEIKSNAKKKKQYLLAPLVLFLKLIASFSSDSTRKKHRYDLTLDPKVILGGNNLIMITRKRNLHS